ncbi:MAG: hypothetical protein M1817_006520 [Caeruleum heppii]|nr:MAG: hypothetical protein M1817_006520 [Caeruleum heppii]
MEFQPALSCPFCPFTDHDTYILLLHVETLHAEGESPFVVREGSGEAASVSGVSRPLSFTAAASPRAPSEAFVECPEHDCGEAILLTDLDTHLDMHLAENLSVAELGQVDVWSPEDTKMNNSQHEPYFSAHLSPALRNLPHDSLDSPADAANLVIADGFRYEGDRSPAAEPSTPANASKTLTFQPKRLGTAELGPYAFEDRMPHWLRKQIEVGPEVKVSNRIRQDGTLEKVRTVANETIHLLPMIAQLCEQDRSVTEAYLCHPGVCHVAKMRREGGFCGYRNIQMLISYLRAVDRLECPQFRERIPNIFQLQDLIEEAWNRGYNRVGLVETGGIKGTRKYIGTSEAQALFLSLDVPCTSNAFGRGTDAASSRPQTRLLAAVEAYFKSGRKDGPTKVHQTDLPPVYFQHQGHSMTIVGLEIRQNGSRNLLVFDPMFKTSPAALKLLGKRFTHRLPDSILKSYRRGDEYLRKYGAFETLHLQEFVDPIET